MTFWMTFCILGIFGIAFSVVIFLPLIREDMELQEERKKIQRIKAALDKAEKTGEVR